MLNKLFEISTTKEFYVYTYNLKYMTPNNINKKSTTPQPTPTLRGKAPLSAASLVVSSQRGSSPDHFPSSKHLRRKGPTLWYCGRQWYSMELPKSVELFDMMIRPFSIVPGDLQSIAGSVNI